MKLEHKHFEIFRSKCGKKHKPCRKANGIALFTKAFLTAAGCHGARRGRREEEISLLLLHPQHEAFPCLG